MGRVDDFERGTRIARIGDQSWATHLRSDWGLWSPAGGYISALALRAAGEATAFLRPASMTCHFLRMGKYAPAEIHVTSLKAGRRSELLKADLVQDQNILLSCHVWAVPDSAPGLLHDQTRIELPDPGSIKTLEEQFPDAKVHPFFQRLEQRPIRGMPRPGDLARDAELTGFYRFLPNAAASDVFADAGRSLILMDAFGWLAQYPAHPEDDPSPWIAPNIDLFRAGPRSFVSTPTQMGRITAGAQM